MRTTLLILGLFFLCLTGKSQENTTKPDTLFSPNDYLSFSRNTNSFQNFTSKEANTEHEAFDNVVPRTSYKNSVTDKKYNAFLSSGVFGTTNKTVPFWMRSMQYGSVPSDGLSLSFIGGVTKDYTDISKKQLMDWGAGFEGRANVGNDSKFILIEGYAKVRLSIFELKGGRFREQIGLVDSTLSSGAFALSGNALGIPKIEAGIPDYWNIPLTKGVIAIKGNIAHGWMDKQTLNQKEDNTVMVPEIDAYLHQISAYGRIGKSTWKVKLYGGANHMVVWGHEKDIFPEWELSEFETLKYVILGKEYGNNAIPSSKVGNHVGSVDQGMEIQLKKSLITLYHQFFYDVGALKTLANGKDGLWGVSVKNQKTKAGNFYWNKFLFEFLYSKSQGGEIDSKERASGAEDYYNNFLYLNGWVYYDENLGNPLFTSLKYIREGYPSIPTQYIQNNRLAAFHGGLEFQLKNWYCKSLVTYSLNYGTYRTSSGERGAGTIIYYYDPPYFPEVHQFSVYFEGQRTLKNNFELGIQLAVDQGDLLYNSVGVGISLTKRW